MKKKISVSIFIIVVIYILLGLFGNKVLANTPGTLTSDINGIDDNKYPGYKTLMNEMKAKHPNYRFLVYYTGMDWNEVINTEYQGHGTSPLNLFQVGTKYNGMWQCPICGIKKYDDIRKELKECADIAAYLDKKMMAINEEVKGYKEHLEDVQSEVDNENIVVETDVDREVNPKENTTKRFSFIKKNAKGK